MSARSGPSSQSAERADAKKRRPEQARQAATGRAVGPPQRAHCGSASGRSCAPHSSHIHSPGLRQATQRRGRASRTSEAIEGMRPG